MAQDFTLISFNDGSAQANLYTGEQCEQAVRDGRIRPDTLITVFRGSENSRMRADAFPLFAALFSMRGGGGNIDLTKAAGFGKDDPGDRPTEAASVPRWVGRSLGWNQSPQAPESYEPEPPAYPPAQPDRGRYADPYESDSRPTEVYREPTSRERRSGDPYGERRSGDPYPDRNSGDHDRRQTSRPGGGSGGGGGGGGAKWFLLLLLPVLLLIGGIVYIVGEELEWWKGGTDSGGGDNSSELVEDGTEGTFYTVRQVDVQDKARAGTPITTLPRGTSLTGMIVADENDSNRKWLRIRYGPQTGRFVAAADLNEKSRPLLDITTISGERTLSAAETIRTDPSSSSPAIASGAAVSAGTSVIVAGKVNAEWVEILPSDGGVGYLPLSAFGPAPSASASPTPEAPPTTSGTHQILITNSCKTKQLTIAIYYYDGQRWQTNDGSTWTFKANDSSYPVIGNNRLLAASDVLYYTAFYGEGSISGFDDGDLDVNYGGQKVKMRRASLNKLDNGDYEIPFNCDN